MPASHSAGCPTVVLGEPLADQLKRAMRGVAATVTIVTTGAQGEEPCAMLVSSFTSVSLDPPTVLVCVNQQASIHTPLVRLRRFCINALQGEHEPLARACATAKGTGRFAQGNWRTDDDGLPYLEDAQTAFFCETLEQLKIGSHTILVGLVTRLHTSAALNPLLFVDGQYCNLNRADRW
jgi:flavin reductase (DIM6/NTAB) family NADH-FMN oxidoreductase RutF